MNPEIVDCVRKAITDKKNKERERQEQENKRLADEKKVKEAYVKEIKEFFKDLPQGIEFKVKPYDLKPVTKKEHWYGPSYTQYFKDWIDERFREFPFDTIVIINNFGFIGIYGLNDLLSSYWTDWRANSDIMSWNVLYILTMKENLGYFEKKIGELYGCSK